MFPSISQHRVGPTAVDSDGKGKVFVRVCVALTRALVAIDSFLGEASRGRLPLTRLTSFVPSIGAENLLLAYLPLANS